MAWGQPLTYCVKCTPHKLQHFLFAVHSKLAVSPDDVTKSHDVSGSDVEIQPLCKGPLGAIVCKALKIKERKKKKQHSWIRPRFILVQQPFFLQWPTPYNCYSSTYIIWRHVVPNPEETLRCQGQ